MPPGPQVKNYCTLREVVERGVCPIWTETNTGQGASLAGLSDVTFDAQETRWAVSTVGGSRAQRGVRLLDR